MSRCWNLIQQIGRFAETDVVTLQADLSQLATENGYRSKKIRFLVPAITSDRMPVFQGLYDAIRFRLFYETLSSAEGNYLKIIPLLRLIKERDYDLVIFEHLESLIAWRKLKRYFPRASFVFDAHNVDHILLSRSENDTRLKKIKLLEETLYRKFDQIWVCSASDEKIFNDLNKTKVPVVVVPNGIDSGRNPYRPPDFSRSLRCIFCGSLDYQPNDEGLTWFLKSVWPDIVNRHTDLRLLVVGKGKPSVELLDLLKYHSSVDLIGEVNDVIPFYRDAQVAIVPILHGSGTRLKILEAMSLGVPVVSTSAGAEGIDYTPGKDILIANTVAEFSNSVTKLFNDASLVSEISQEGKNLVEAKYSWDMIGNRVCEELSLVEKR